MKIRTITGDIRKMKAMTDYVQKREMWFRKASEKGFSKAKAKDIINNLTKELEKKYHSDEYWMYEGIIHGLRGYIAVLSDCQEIIDFTTQEVTSFSTRSNSWITLSFRETKIEHEDIIDTLEQYIEIVGRIENGLLLIFEHSGKEYNFCFDVNADYETRSKTIKNIEKVLNS